MPVIVRKVLQLIAVFIAVTLFTVALISLVPGKPEDVVIPYDPTEKVIFDKYGEDAPDRPLTVREQFRKDNDLDRPLVVRWAKWAGKFIQGDMGNYYEGSGTNKVSTSVGQNLPTSVLLIIYTQLFSLLVAVPVAIWAAYRSGSRLDKLLNAIAFGFISLPSFAVALILSYYLGVQQGWVPSQGYTRPSEDLVLHLKSMVIPVVALSLGQIAVYMRLLRSDLVATLQEDFILMAKAKGISNGRVLWRHALRPSSLVLLTVAGLNVGTLIGGTVVVESLLNIPGLGFLIGKAVLARQYVALQSLVALIAIFFVLMNFLIDYLYSVLDPRIRERS